MALRIVPVRSTADRLSKAATAWAVNPRNDLKDEGPGYAPALLLWSVGRSSYEEGQIVGVRRPRWILTDFTRMSCRIVSTTASRQWSKPRKSISAIPN